MGVSTSSGGNKWRDEVGGCGGGSKGRAMVSRGTQLHYIVQFVTIFYHTCRVGSMVTSTHAVLVVWLAVGSMVNGYIWK